MFSLLTITHPVGEGRRALLIANSSAGSTFVYRADGQRVEKVDGVTIAWTGSKRSGHYDTNTTQNGPTSRYFYDGQMGMEDDYNPSGTITPINRYGLGARGIDRIENYASSTTTYGYPLYDGHGNMRAVLAKSGSSYTTGNWRSYDVWGSLRSGGSSTDPKQGYCANLGHVADSESGLIYMRARYMEPASGRFISEDPALDGGNWFAYCGSQPVTRSDRNGQEFGLDDLLWYVAHAAALGAGLYYGERLGYDIYKGWWYRNGKIGPGGVDQEAQVIALHDKLVGPEAVALVVCEATAMWIVHTGGYALTGAGAPSLALFAAIGLVAGYLIGVNNAMWETYLVCMYDSAF